MSTYTIISRSVICPEWGEEIIVHAKYRFTDNPQNQYEARFIYAECEICENLHTPESKQDKRLELFRFCRIGDCPKLKGFKEIIDIRKDGYVQS